MAVELTDDCFKGKHVLIGLCQPLVPSRCEEKSQGDLTLLTQCSHIVPRGDLRTHLKTHKPFEHQIMVVWCTFYNWVMKPTLILKFQKKLSCYPQITSQYWMNIYFIFAIQYINEFLKIIKSQIIKDNFCHSNYSKIYHCIMIFMQNVTASCS